MHPTISVCYAVIGKSLLDDGLDPSRPLPSIVIQVRDMPVLIANTISLNMQFGMGKDAYPQIFDDDVIGANLAISHLNITLRLSDACVTSLSGSLEGVNSEFRSATKWH